MSIKDRTLERGLPDWSNVRKRAGIVTLSDLGEIPPRLGSIVRFDRRGDVLFLDPFEDGINKFGTITTGVGAAVTPRLGTARSGAIAVRVLSSATNGEESGIETSVPYGVFVPLGFEISASVPAADYMMRLRLILYTGTTYYEAGIRYRQSTTTFQYLDSAGAWQDLSPTLGLFVAAAAFNTWKLVADPTTGEYRYFLANAKAYDLAGISLRTGASATLPSVYISALASTQESAAVAVLLDDVIVTQNEP